MRPAKGTLMGIGGVSCRSILATMMLAVLLPLPAPAQTLEQALAQAYRNNETLNAERASLRGTDEEVSQALSGYRPRVEATADVGRRYLDEKGADGQRQKSTTTPRGVGLTATQSIFNGFQTSNRVRMAESQVRAGRDALRLMEQTVLLDAVTAYMDALRDAVIVELQRRNLELLREQLDLTRDRLRTGEVTSTDVAQVQSRLAAARSELLAAQAAYNTSRATFERVIGSEPGKLTPGRPADRFVLGERSESADRVGAIPGAGSGARLGGCAARVRGRPTRYVRTPHHTTGATQCPRCPGYVPARPRGRLVHAACGGGRSVAASAPAAHPGLRPIGALLPSP